MQRTLWPIVTRLLAEGPDEVLLERYFRHRDQEAFAQLLTRYNRLVWGQCRNLLANDADAEDAFQATFLTLARSAKRLKAGSPLGPWLHGVAFRVCMNARRVIGRRAKREKASAQPDVQQPVADSSWEKAFAAVAEEVQRLPETQRVAFVLCYLEGQSVVDAAASLGQKLGTFTSRLSRAKQALLDRLAKRGLGVGVLALSGVTGSAVVAPAALVERSLALLPSGVAIPGSIQVLTQGVTGMSLIPFKLLAACLMLITGLGTGAGILTHRTLAAGPQEAGKEPISQLEAKVPVPKAKPREDKEMLQGTWNVVNVDTGGPIQPKEISKDQILVFTRDKLVINYDDGSSREMTYQLDPKQKPRAIDLSPTDEREKGYTFKGIYELDGDRLKLYYSRNVAPDAERPAQFEPKGEDRGMRSYVLKRAPAVGDKLPKSVEAQLKWGEPVDGLRAALAIRPIPGVGKPGDLPDLFLVVQNVSKSPLRFSNVTEVPEVGTIYLRGDGMIKWSGTFEWPTRVDVTLKPGEVAFQPLFPLDPKDGVRLGSGIADDVVKLPRYSLVAKMQVEKTATGAWTGKLVTGETSGAAAEIKSDPLKPAPKDLGKIPPPGGVPLPLVKPGTNAIGVDQLNKVKERLEAVPADDLEKWVVELERILDEKLKEGVPGARQVCRTDFAIHMSVAFDDLKWNAKTGGDLFHRAQTMPASEAKVWKEAFEAMLKQEIGQTDATNFAGGPSWAVPLVLIPVDALHEGQKYSAERGKKYRARLKQLTADDVSLWKDKVDEFGGTKLDAAVNIILLEDYFDREKFQRDRFKAAIEGRKK